MTEPRFILDQESFVRPPSPTHAHHSPTAPKEKLLSPRSTFAKLQVQWSEDKTTNATTPPLTALAALNADEKDAIIVYLIQKVKDQKAMQDAAIKFGEEMAAQLVLEQHERNAAYEAKISNLEKELHKTIHEHPEVDRLSALVLDLKVQLDKERQNVQSAIKKCRRSREREKQLKMAIDPLWE
ncbi:unnamed protein product [Aphanomyces euteiches]|nr:hypothetical protein AeRB84_021605 [Aphanomyces euteiches]